ncbi:MAG: alpha/beta hydrolase [Desulfobacterales bacterium]|nr:alpha/beta hydrolase [Desulfobacterales bacterium]
MQDEAVEINGFDCRMISNPGKGPCIVILHGYMYTSDVWNEIGLLRLLEKKGIPFKAIDMPYGHSNESAPRNPDPAENAAIVARLAPPEAVLIGASLGGYIALRHCVANRASGVMVIAPVMSLQQELASLYSRLSMPVSIIYGDADNVVYPQEIRRLARLLDTDVRVYENARHAAYMDQPERFRKDVLAFYGAITRPDNPAS